MNTTERNIIRRSLYDKQGGRCRWCNRLMIRPRNGKFRQPLPADAATIDHVIPVTRGGTDDSSNLVLACHACNRKNGNTLPIERELGL